MNPRLWLGLCGAGLFFSGVYLQLPLLCLLLAQRTLQPQVESRYSKSQVWTRWR